MGTISTWRVAMRPGKPVLIGKLRDAVFIGLPGNPVSSSVTFELFARPVIRRMQGAQELHRRRMRVRMGEEMTKPADARDVRARGLAHRRGRRPAERAQLGRPGIVDAALAHTRGLPAGASRWTSRSSPPAPSSRRSRCDDDRDRAARGGDRARSVRPLTSRPAHLGDRPLQLPLPVLHAQGAVRTRPPLPASRRGARRARDRATRRQCSHSLGVTKIRLTGGEPLLRGRPRRHRCGHCRTRHARYRADHQRRAAPALGGRACARRACTG